MLTVLTRTHDPFYNQAFEEFVFETFRDDDVFLLWQNSPAVVVGSYQNICREVHVQTLRKLGIPIVRRMSGGGKIQFKIDVQKGSIKNAAVYGDFFSTLDAGTICGALTDCRYRREDVLEALKAHGINGAVYRISAQEMAQTIVN